MITLTTVDGKEISINPLFVSTAVEISTQHFTQSILSGGAQTVSVVDVTMANGQVYRFLDPNRTVVLAITAGQKQGH